MTGIMLIMIGRKIYNDPMFLNDIDISFYKNGTKKLRYEVIKNYIDICKNYYLIDDKQYLLLRHLYGLYYGTNLSKQWKKFLNSIIVNKRNIDDILKFTEYDYKEKIQSYC